MWPAPLAALLLALAPSAVHGSDEEDSVSLLQRTLTLGPPVQNVAPAKLVVDLDAAPEQRWRNVTRHYMAIGALPGNFKLSNPTDTLTMRLLESTPLPAEFRREMEGIVADVGDPDLTVEALHISNIGYELSGTHQPDIAWLLNGALHKDRSVPHGCSGILAAMPDGTVVHGRNMDYFGYDVKANGRVLHYPDVTVEVLFMKGGRPFISSIHWPGQLGFHTALRFGGWSFEQNTRFHGAELSAVFALLQHSEGFMLRSRRIMEATPDFETAVQRLYNSNLMAPQYFIVAGAGPYEGAVLSMDRGGQHLQDEGTPPLVRLSKQTTSTRGVWHLVQTNDDRFEPPLDFRRHAEQVRLSAATQDVISPEWMYGELTSEALYNPVTVFSTVYVPATGFSRTFVHPNNWK